MTIGYICNCSNTENLIEDVINYIKIKLWLCLI